VFLWSEGVNIRNLLENISASQQAQMFAVQGGFFVLPLARPHSAAVLFEAIRQLKFEISPISSIFCI
jgi:hypothetical protein